MKRTCIKLQKGAGWQPDELKFLLDNFFNMTNQELTDHINNYRLSEGKLTVSGVIAKCRDLGLSRWIQIRWSKKDVKRLQKWYPLMGNKEIARLLNEVGTSRRSINGKWIYRKFSLKHVEKKMTLLKLRRTTEQLERIKADNLLINTPAALEKMWKKRGIAKEEEIRIWKDRRVIKIGGSFIHYTRWMYHNFIKPLQQHEIVFHIDLDSLNDDPENLEIRTRKTQRVSLLDRKRALPLLQKRLETEQKVFDKIISSEEKREKMKAIIRLQRLISDQEQHLSKNKVEIHSLNY